MINWVMAVIAIIFKPVVVPHFNSLAACHSVVTYNHKNQLGQKNVPLAL
jgi:hypothetical protein